MRSSPALPAALLIALLACSCSRMRSPLTPGIDGSVGLPHIGMLSNAVELPRSGPAHEWLRPAGHHFGTPVLVDAILHGAAEVERQRPGSPRLRVGDLSARHGGRLRGHASHRTGRDADLLFYTSSLSGAPIPSPGFVRIGPDGLASLHPKESGPYVQLDVERNWLLVKALVEAPGPGVTWLFVSRPVEALLTEYALARGEDPVVVWHAESVMLQPRNALPHDDHFHLRIACSMDMAVQGCEDNGPEWPWLPSVRQRTAFDQDERLTELEPDSLPPLGSSPGHGAAAP